MCFLVHCTSPPKPSSLLPPLSCVSPSPAACGGPSLLGAAVPQPGSPGTHIVPRPGSRRRCCPCQKKCIDFARVVHDSAVRLVVKAVKETIEHAGGKSQKKALLPFRNAFGCIYSTNSTIQNLCTGSVDLSIRRSRTILVRLEGEWQKRRASSRHRSKEGVCQP